MTNATNDLTTQKTNWTNPWTNSPEQLNLKWNNDRMNESLLFYKDGERLCKEKTAMKSPVTKKSWKKPFSHKQGLSISKTNQPHIVEYFFSSQTDLAIFMLTDPTSPFQDSFNYRVGELIEQNDDIGDLFIVPNLLEKNGI